MGGLPGHHTVAEGFHLPGMRQLETRIGDPAGRQAHNPFHKHQIHFGGACSYCEGVGWGSAGDVGPMVDRRPVAAPQVIAGLPSKVG